MQNKSKKSHGTCEHDFGGKPMTNERLKLIKNRAKELKSEKKIPLRFCVKQSIEENVTIHEMSILSTIFDLSIESLTDIILEVVK